MLLLQHWLTSSLGGQVRTQHREWRLHHTHAASVCSESLSLRSCCSRRSGNPATTQGWSSGKHLYAAAQRSIHQVETVSRRRRQTEKTFSTENSCRDIPVTLGWPKPQWNQTADKQTKSHGETRARYHFNASSIRTNVYRGLCSA